MKKGIIFLLAILFPFALVVFPQWTDTPPSRIDYSLSSLVLVAPGGMTIHKDKCKLLTGTEKAMTLRDAAKDGFKRGARLCPECFPEAFPPSFVWTFTLEAPIKSNDLRYTDGLIDIVFQISSTQVGFDIQNNSADGIKINWDELSFISVTNTASRIIHSGIKLVSRNSPQAPTIIPPGVKITDVAIPSENIIYADGWETGRLFDGDYMSYNGKEFGLYIPLEIDGKKNEITFKFKITVTQVANLNKLQTS